MNTDKEKPEGSKRLREQLKRHDYRDALRSRYGPAANEKQFDQLLERLEDAERENK